MTLTYKKLLEQYPEDGLCAFCGAKNDWDQAGFFYLYPYPNMVMEEGKATCKRCRGGPAGTMHEKLHGKGTEGR